MQVAGGFGAIGLDQARYDRMMYLQTGVSPLGPGSDVSQNEPELLASEGSGGPPGSRLILDGSLAFPRPLIFLQSPGNAAPDTFVFPGRESDDPGAQPFIASEGSVDSGGATYSQTEVLGPSAMLPPAMIASSRARPRCWAIFSSPRARPGPEVRRRASRGSPRSPPRIRARPSIRWYSDRMIRTRPQVAPHPPRDCSPAVWYLCNSTRSGLGPQVSTAPPKETSIQPPRRPRSPVPTRSHPRPCLLLRPTRPCRARPTALTSEFPPGRLRLETLVRSARSSPPSVVIQRLKSSATAAPCIRKSTIEMALPDPPMISGRTQSGRTARPRKHGAAITLTRGSLPTVRADFRCAPLPLRKTAARIWAVWSRRSDSAQPTFARGPLKALTSLIAPRSALSRPQPKSEMTRRGTPSFSRRPAASRSVWPCPRALSSPASCSERRIAYA